MSRRAIVCCIADAARANAVAVNGRVVMPAAVRYFSVDRASNRGTTESQTDMSLVRRSRYGNLHSLDDKTPFIIAVLALDTSGWCYGWLELYM